MTTEYNTKTLFFIKPDGILRRAVGANVLKQIIEDNIEISKAHLMSVPRSFFINIHYNVHKGRFFFDWLIDYVTLTPILVMILEGNNIILRIREMLGDTMPTKASPMSIRGRYGIFGGVNVAHSSDSASSAMEEITRWSTTYLSEQVNRVDVNKYIDDYLDYPLSDVIKYRSISKQLSNLEINEEEAASAFIDLLNPETDFSREYIEQFVNLLVRNALMDREKK